MDVLRMYYGCRGGLSEEKVIIPDLMAKEIERLRKIISEGIELGNNYQLRLWIKRAKRVLKEVE